MRASRAAHYASRACALEVATWGISRQESMRASAEASYVAQKASIVAQVKSRVAQIICTSCLSAFETTLITATTLESEA